MGQGFRITPEATSKTTGAVTFDNCVVTTAPTFTQRSHCTTFHPIWWF